MKSKTIAWMSACLALVFTSGCLGPATRAMMTNKASYQSIRASAGPIPTDRARIWVYMIGGYSTKEAMMRGPLTYAITFNRTVYRLGGDAFYFVDIPAGQCRVTTTDVFKGGLGVHPHFRLGKIQKRFDFDVGKEYFLRATMETSSAKLTPFDLVNQTQGESEMASLKHFTKAQLEDPKYTLDEATAPSQTQ